MSDFVPEGKTDRFPNLYSDEKELHRIVEWSDEALAYKTDLYGEFIQRDDIMPRAQRLGNRILDHCIFELACRDGVYGSNE